MIKGLAITPPILGRISIGKVVEKNGKRLPEKDDQFTITSQIQNKDGWVKHPLDEQLRAKAQNQKLRTIPVRMILMILNSTCELSTLYSTDKLVGPSVLVMVKPVSDLDKTGLNSIHVHHLIYAPWPKVDTASLMGGFTSI